MVMFGVKCRSCGKPREMGQDGFITPEYVVKLSSGYRTLVEVVCPDCWSLFLFAASEYGREGQ